MFLAAVKRWLRDKRYAVAIGAVFFVAAYSAAQEIGFRLPNPDGRDPVFDQSNAGKPIDIKFLDLNETQRSLDDFSGSLRLINFWATWCAPCIRELPSLAALGQRYSADEIQLIPISLDQKGAAGVPGFVAGLQVQGLNWFVDPTAISGQAADVYVLPTSVIVDANGNELGRIVGSANWDSPEAQRLVDSLLGAKPPN